MGKAMLVATALLLAGCDTETIPTLPSDVLSGAHLGFGLASSGNVIVVPPSGDVTGQADPRAIEMALNSADPGDLVLLSDGDLSTVDHYFASEGVVVLPGFRATLSGEGPDNTVINAIKKPDGSDFEFTFVSAYTPIGTGTWPTLLHFEFPDAVTVRDLSITQIDPAPNIPYFQHIVVWGGDHDVLVTDVRLSDPSRTSESVGVHVMGGTQAQAMDGVGAVEILNSEFNGMAYGVLPMWYGPGSRITIAGSHFRQGGSDVWTEGNAPSSITVRGNRFHSTEGAGVFLVESSHVAISGNTFVDGQSVGVLLRKVTDVEVADNLFRDSHYSAWWHSGVYARDDVRNSRITGNSFEDLSFTSSAGTQGAIFLRGLAGSPVIGNEIDHNNFVKSGLPGWTRDGLNGPAAIWLDPHTSQNRVHEMQFPADPGKTLCDMIVDLTDNESTSVYDGANDIHSWRPCENFSAQDLDQPVSFRAAP